ncbi:hypothetical protein F9L33_03515 [Amylibacter sp. SFDW26]|uniref:hypothetical protein n=1 Tax=Amylibacter sp. SFDW26 TaxID=2652722 RepID=UPI001261B0EE|nr:hypothetical protein [Amylibacter sp. SFDW26]KAB7615840.1 hypothetical protein F9L33_03515 [Amylibacter sp. SFDW26]
MTAFIHHSRKTEPADKSQIEESVRLNALSVNIVQYRLVLNWGVITVPKAQNVRDSILTPHASAHCFLSASMMPEAINGR